MTSRNGDRGRRRGPLLALCAGGLWLLACGEGGGGTTGGGGSAGEGGENPGGVMLTDSGEGGTATPADTGVGGQPPPGGTTPDAAPPTGDAQVQSDDATVAPPDGGPPPDPDAAPPVSNCAGREVIDLNAWLADNGGYDGDTAAAGESALAASCGGAAGGEVVFRYRVDRPLDRLIFRTDHPETQAPTVLYVRAECERPEDLACNRGAPGNPGTRAVLEAPTPGVYYVIVDTGARDGGGPFRLTVEENGASGCRDTEDNDGDGLVDLADPGCESGDDDAEQDPVEVPACADGLDNDSDGLTDYPADPDCSAAGVTREGPLCELDLPMTDVTIDGGIFPVSLPFVGPDLARGSCTFEIMPEHLFVLTLDRPADVTVINRSLQQFRQPVALYARRECADGATEIACGDMWSGTMSMRGLEAGVYFVFAEASQGGGIDGGPVPLGGSADVEIEFRVRPSHPECSDEIDNDRDGLTDLTDPGCRDARDDDEADPVLGPFCNNGVDDDGDGAIDYPGDDGCTGAGDVCEEVGFDFCDGVCQDVVGNEQHCGRCGVVCDEGVECLDGYCGGRVVFEGYRTDLSVNELVGWELCWAETYGESSPLADLLGACDGEQVLVACRPAGDDVFQLAAMGDTAEVFRDTGDNNNDTNEHNGVGWYFSENTSVGFVPGGAVPARNSCDTNALGENGNDDGTGEGRMCWHSGGGSTQGGYRCGNTTAFDQRYERLVYTVPRRIEPPVCDNGQDDDRDGLVDAHDPGCASPYDTDEADPGVAGPPVCGNEIDDDEDGVVDYPADPDCLTAGDGSEAPRCGLGVPVTEVGQAGGAFVVSPVDGADGTAGTCGDGFGRAQVFAVTLDDPSDLTVTVTRDGEPARAVIYLRDMCDDPRSERACRGDARGILEARNLERGVYYVFVERRGARSDLTVSIDVASNIRQCNDLIDNDGDERTDNADPGCRTPFDDLEADDPEVAPACFDGIDNDEDGVTDWPDDGDCTTAGDAYEQLLCRADVEVVELPAVTGSYAVEYGAQGFAQASCGDGPIGEAVYLLHLDDPSFVEVSVRSGPIFGDFVFGTTSIRSACDDAGSEIACAGDQWDGRATRVDRLEPGDYIIISDYSPNWQPGDPNLELTLQLVVRSLLQVCENRRDDDGDGLIDAEDVGCESALDTDERDPDDLSVVWCSNGQDDDGDGAVDFPADDGCAAAGDFCEEVDFIQCDGVCLDGQTDANNCGVCGTVCERGVECIDGYCGGAVPVFPQDAFGHHGSCDAWNDCQNAEGCANAACQVAGFARALSWEEGSCQQLPNEGIRCNLFFGLSGGSLDYDPDYRGCELPVAYNILCAPN